MIPLRRDVLRALVAPLALCAGMVVLGEVLLYRMPWTDNQLDLVGENGRFELAQTVFGVAFGATMVLIARAHARVRPLAILMAGFAVALLVREQNNYFLDHVGKGAWQAVVGVVALATCAIAWPSRRALPDAILDLLRRPAAGLLIAAVAVFAYAQLFDEMPLWRHLLDTQDPPFAARRVTEEGLELAAYVLAFAAGLAWRAGLVRSDAASGQHDA